MHNDFKTKNNDFKTKNGFIEEPFLQALETLPGG